MQFMRHWSVDLGKKLILFLQMPARTKYKTKFNPNNIPQTQNNFNYETHRSSGLTWTSLQCNADPYYTITNLSVDVEQTAQK